MFRNFFARKFLVEGFGEIWNPLKYSRKTIAFSRKGCNRYIDVLTGYQHTVWFK